jgi:CelD/BcsL family acetyltransferase involved in cellulose biosynthesis
MTVPLLPVITPIRDDAGLEVLAPEWDELLADSPAGGVFLSWAWISAWRTTLGRHHLLRLWTARHPDDGRLLGVAPLAVERRGRGPFAHRALVFLGSGPAAPDHLDLVVRHGYEHSLGPALWDAVRRRPDWDLVDLDGAADGSLVERLALRRRTDRSRIESMPAPALPLPATWEDYVATLGKNLRQNLRRYRRKLDREAPGPVTERLVVEPDDIAATIEELGDLHQAIRTERGDRGAFATAGRRRFHGLVAQYMNEAGRLRLHRLDIGGEMVAGIVCFRYGDVVSFYTTGYDAAWGRYGPGRRIMACAIAGAIDEGAAVFDFLRGGEEYKAHWGAGTGRVVRLRRPVGSRGRLLWGMGTIRRGIRRLLPGSS